jgi:hypothetical protein
MRLKSGLIFVLTFEALFLHSNAFLDGKIIEELIKACKEHPKECLKIAEDVFLKSKEILYLFWGLIIAYPWIVPGGVIFVIIFYSPEIMLAIADWNRRFKKSLHELYKSYDWQEYGQYSSM